MKIAVVGSRTFVDKVFLRMIVEEYFMTKCRFHRPIFVSGGAKGVDKEAEGVIDYHNLRLKEDGIKKEIFLPDWDNKGKSAGFIRNKLIVDTADHIVAFWDGESKGTKQ